MSRRTEGKVGRYIFYILARVRYLVHGGRGMRWDEMRWKEYMNLTYVVVYISIYM